jgi:hypothetical protein
MLQLFGLVLPLVIFRIGIAEVKHSLLIVAAIIVNDFLSIFYLGLCKSELLLNASTFNRLRSERVNSSSKMIEIVAARGRLTHGEFL